MLRTIKKCGFGGCDKPRRCKGLCQGHYLQLKAGKGLRPLKVHRPKGSGAVTRDGYIQIMTNGRSGLQHRFVMEEILGRALLDTETVHHKNGVRSDNRPENLELWSICQPPGQRIEDKTAWAVEWLRQYAPELLA